jgi:hypothetical protein
MASGRSTFQHRMRRDRTPTVDLSALADLIERQARELADLREAATVWQLRARQAEDKLLELAAGPVVTDTQPDPAPDPAPDTPGSPLSHEPGQTRRISWWRRWWRRWWRF